MEGTTVHSLWSLCIFTFNPTATQMFWQIMLKCYISLVLLVFIYRFILWQRSAYGLVWFDHKKTLGKGQ